MVDPRLAVVASDYPFQSRFLKVDAARMHFVDEGAGEPIALLHGNPTWSFYYRELVKGLRGSHRVIAPDHVGCGLSDKPRDYPYTLSTHVENFGRLMDHLQLDGVTLGVHDWGGPIGLGWAVRNPQRVRRLIIFNTAAFLDGVMPLRIRMCRWPIYGRSAVQGLNLFLRASFFMGCHKRERMTPNIRRGYLLPYDSYANRVGVFRFIQDIPLSPRVPSYDVFRSIEVGLPTLRDRPMLILWGMRDFCFTPRFLDAWVRRFPQAEVHRFEDAGHYVVEDAHERILPLVRRFIGHLGAPTEHEAVPGTRIADLDR